MSVCTSAVQNSCSRTTHSAPHSNVNSPISAAIARGANYLISKRTDIYPEVDRNQVTGAYPLPAFMAARGSQTGVSLGLRQRF